MITDYFKKKIPISINKKLIEMQNIRHSKIIKNKNPQKSIYNFIKNYNFFFTNDRNTDYNLINSFKIIV